MGSYACGCGWGDHATGGMPSHHVRLCPLQGKLECDDGVKVVSLVSRSGLEGRTHSGHPSVGFAHEVRQQPWREERIGKAGRLLLLLVLLLLVLRLRGAKAALRLLGVVRLLLVLSVPVRRGLVLPLRRPPLPLRRRHVLRPSHHDPRRCAPRRRQKRRERHVRVSRHHRVAECEADLLVEDELLRQTRAEQRFGSRESAPSGTEASVEAQACHQQPSEPAPRALSRQKSTMLGSLSAPGAAVSPPIARA